MWELQLPWYEIVFRAFLIFSFLFIILRVLGKKHFSEMTPFDFIIFLFISEAVQNAMIDNDRGIPAALISVSTLVLLNAFLSKISFRSKKAEEMIEGNPKELIKDGVVNKAVLKEEAITDRELYQALRMQGVLSVEEVRLAMLETNGSISVIKKDESFH